MVRFRKKGFTLVEIMIVVAIIALLVGVLVPNMLRARINANQTSAQATLKSFAVACETYAAANAAIYPTSVSDLTTKPAPYFSFDITSAPKDGYSFTAEFGNNSYTVTASPLPNAGNWEYRVTAGVVLKKRKAGSSSEWEVF